MRKHFAVVSVCGALVLVWLGVGFLRPRSHQIGHAPGKSSESNATKSLILRKAIPQPTVRQEVAATPGDGGALYEEFKKQKLCLDAEGTPDSLRQDIADLSEAIRHIQPDLANSGPELDGYVHSLEVQSLETEIQRKEAQLEISSRCVNGRANREDVGRLLERAARQGNPDAQLAYAQDPIIDRGHSIADLDRLKAWSEVALKYAESAAQRGNADAILSLGGAYDPLECEPANKPYCTEMLSQLVNPDALTAYRYFYQSKLSGQAPDWLDVELRTLEQYLTEDQIADAQRMAQAAVSTSRQDSRENAH